MIPLVEEKMLVARIVGGREGLITDRLLHVDVDSSEKVNQFDESREFDREVVVNGLIQEATDFPALAPRGRAGP